MPALTRRDLLRASAGAAIVAVPMAALAGPSALASPDADTDLDGDVALASSGPVMFCIQDAARGEVSILQGSSEVVVTDRKLVRQIMRAAGTRQEG